MAHYDVTVLFREASDFHSFAQKRVKFCTTKMEIISGQSAVHTPVHFAMKLIPIISYISFKTG